MITGDRRKPKIIETNISNSFGGMKYFSVNTHTVYPPHLTFKWDDSSHSKQSSAKQSGELNVSLYRNKEEFNQNDEATFRIHVRDKYPIRQFASSSNYLNPGYFTTASYYSVRDAHTEQEIDAELLQGLERRAYRLLRADADDWLTWLDNDDFWQPGWRGDDGEPSGDAGMN